MKYNRVALVLLCLVILGTPYYLNAAVCSSSCEASGKIINIISGNEYEIEYIENADIPINPKVEAAKLADIEIIYPLKAEKFAEETLQNQIVCLVNTSRDFNGELTCTIYKKFNNQQNKSLNKILVELGYARMKESTQMKVGLNKNAYSNIPVISIDTASPIQEDSNKNPPGYITVIKDSVSRDIENISPIRCDPKPNSHGHIAVIRNPVSGDIENISPMSENLNMGSFGYIAVIENFASEDIDNRSPMRDNPNTNPVGYTTIIENPAPGDIENISPR